MQKVKPWFTENSGQIYEWNSTSSPKFRSYICIMLVPMLYIYIVNILNKGNFFYKKEYLKELYVEPFYKMKLKRQEHI